MSVRFEGVGHKFTEEAWLFRGLTLQLSPGHVYALTGPSGSGKSTLLNLLSRWNSPTEGKVVINVPGRTSWVFQNPHGTPRRSALDHLMLPLLAKGEHTKNARSRSLELLSRFGLREVALREFRALSGGEAQRLMLACGIAVSPGLLLVDEPTAQLDPATAQDVNRAIRELISPETIVVIATHDHETQVACTDHIDLRKYQPFNVPSFVGS
ncbi:ATP-binding cassette domain-containing protein [Leucobacter denitrificans]|uniref:ATP-binding cassette domain-containing protein n=1 Tax=Leucobacter denitrificans TaxID=683042 RepID=A0A7G9S2S0_9MICO|nr:ATP-binding cassette domain-containing protein [Leucobacter denitrificans]QNN62145.1 ATP-binding cassette domain-containing protein [Leucobacter denitrificans]